MVKNIKLFFLLYGLNKTNLNATEFMGILNLNKKNDNKTDRVNTKFSLEEQTSRLSLVDPENQNIFKKELNTPYLVNIQEKNQKLYIKLPTLLIEGNELYNSVENFLCLDLSILSDKNSYMASITKSKKIINAFNKVINNKKFKIDIISNKEYKQVRENSEKEILNNFINSYINEKLDSLKNIYTSFQEGREHKEKTKELFMDIIDTLIKSISIKLEVNLFDMFKETPYILDKNQNKNLVNFKNIYNFGKLVNKDGGSCNMDNITGSMQKILHFITRPIIKNAKNLEKTIYKRLRKDTENYIEINNNNFNKSFKENINSNLLDIQELFAERRIKNYPIEIILNENQLNDSMKEYPIETSIALNQILIFSKIFNTTITVPDEYELKTDDINPEGLFNSDGFILTYYNLNQIKESLKEKHTELNIFLKEICESLSVDNFQQFQWFINYEDEVVLKCKGGLTPANMQLTALLSSKMMENTTNNEIKFIDDNVLIEFILTNFNDLGTFSKDKSNYIADIGSLVKSNIEEIKDKRNFIEKILDKNLLEVMNIKKEKEKSNFITSKEEIIKTTSNVKLPKNMANFKSYTEVVDNSIASNPAIRIINKIKDKILKTSSIQKLTSQNVTYNDKHYDYGFLDNLNFRFKITYLRKDDQVEIKNAFVDLVAGLYDLKELSMDCCSKDKEPLLAIAALNSPSLKCLKLGLLTLESIKVLNNSYMEYKRYVENYKNDKKNANSGILLNNSIKKMEISFSDDLLASQTGIQNFKEFFENFILDLSLKSKIETEGNVEVNIKFVDKVNNNKDILEIFNSSFRNNNKLNIGNKKIENKFNNQLKINVSDIYKESNSDNMAETSYLENYNTYIKVL